MNRYDEEKIIISIGPVEIRKRIWYYLFDGGMLVLLLSLIALVLGAIVVVASSVPRIAMLCFGGTIGGIALLIVLGYLVNTVPEQIGELLD